MGKNTGAAAASAQRHARRLAEDEVGEVSHVSKMLGLDGADLDAEAHLGGGQQRDMRNTVPARQISGGRRVADRDGLVLEHVPENIGEKNVDLLSRQLAVASFPLRRTPWKTRPGKTGSAVRAVRNRRSRLAKGDRVVYPSRLSSARRGARLRALP